MKGNNTWPETKKVLRRHIRPLLKDMVLSLSSSVDGSVAVRVEVVDSPGILNWLRRQLKSPGSAEEQISRAKHNILLLLFFTITVLVLYTVVVMQAIK